MKALDSVKNLLSWGPTVTQQLERVEAIDQRLVHIAARQADERRLVPESEQVEQIIAWIRRRRAYFAAPRQKGVRDASTHLSDVLLGLAQPKPAEPRLIEPTQLEAILFGFLGELLEEATPRVVAEIAAHETTPRGRPAAERPAILARLAEERAELVAERAGLIDAITEASGGTLVVLQLAETRLERANAAHAAQRLADREAFAAEVKLRDPGGVAQIIHTGQRGGPASS